MPIGPKKSEEVNNPIPPVEEKGRCCKRSGDEFGRKILMTLVGVLLVYATFYIGTLMRNEIRKYDFIGQADQMERTISITGTAKAAAKNDIALVNIGYTNSNADVAVAQKENNRVMDQVIAELKKLGIEDKDLQTQYNIYPEYDYTQKGTTFKGYRVSNNLSVKVRDLSKVPAVLEMPTKYGANQVGGLSFTIDDTNALKAEARDKALADARSKAAKLSQVLGVRIGEVISYNDYESSEPYYFARNQNFVADGMGGAAAPEIASGSKDVSMNVTITYKIYSR